MGSIDWVLELILVGLLAITLVHAIRLERALRSLRQDRNDLSDAIAGFDDSARQAEAGIGRLQFATTESSQVLAQRVEQGTSLRDDLTFLIERGGAVADRLDELVRASRGARPSTPPQPPQTPATAATASAPASSAKVRSQAERDLLLALRGAQ